MKLKIQHRTTYRFDKPVYLEPHVVRLRPRVDATLWPRSMALEIEPAPTVRADNLDLEGNVVTELWFAGETDHLTVDSRADVETLVTDPFRFLLTEPERTLPYVYPVEVAERLRAYRVAPDTVSPEVQTFSLDAAREVERRQDRFPWALASRLHKAIAVEHRPAGDPKAPEATLADRQGACRDLAVLFMACCRGMGLAARFVSGYVHMSDDRDDRELHAWAEVYLPGGGWRGFDPTYGVAVADRHVAVAAAAEAVDAAPVSGSFRGDAAAHLTTTVQIAVDGD